MSEIQAPERKPFTSRHRRVVELHVHGHTNREIAVQMGLTPEHVSTILHSPSAVSLIAELNQQVEADTIGDMKQLAKEALLLVTQIMRGRVPIEGETDAQGRPVYQIAPVNARLAAAITILDRYEGTAKVTRHAGHGADKDRAVDAFLARIQARVQELDREQAGGRQCVTVDAEISDAPGPLLRAL